jgi:hypothetical protein
VIGYGVCVGSWERFSRNVGPKTKGSPVIALDNQNCIGGTYNQILEMFASSGAHAVALVHDDLEIIDPDFENKINEVIHADYDPLDGFVLGVAGAASPPPTLSWWDHDPIGHQNTDAGLIDFGIRSGPVHALDGSILVFGNAAIRDLRFNPRYYGFHGYDVDVCRQARQRGYQVLALDIDTHHHTIPGRFKSDESAISFGQADAIYRELWPQ